MIRSRSGKKEESTLRKVVLPEPVPPLTMQLSRASTAALRNSITGAGTAPILIRSSVVRRFLPNRRIVIDAPSIATGSMIALTREPSGSRASTIGDDSSMRRPSGVMMRSMINRSCCASVKCFVVGSMRPRRST